MANNKIANRLTTLERSVFLPISKPALPLHLLSIDELKMLDRYLGGERIEEEHEIIEHVIMPKLNADPASSPNEGAEL